MANRFIKDNKKTEEMIAEIDRRAAFLKEEILGGKNPVPSDFSGRVYYVSESGDDKNDGLSEKSPIRTLSGVAALALSSGDAVLFRRGDTFRGSVKCVSGVTYSAYGEGAKPNIYGSLRNYAEEDLWEDTGINNVWKLKIPLLHDAGVAVFDGGRAHSEKRIKGRSDFPCGGIENLDCDLCLWHDVPAPTNEEGYLYLKSDAGNPAVRFSSIEIARRENIFRVGNAANVTINNLCIRYGGAHGVGAGSCEGLTVSYCEFGWIGGSWFRTDTLSRYGNAIEIYGYAHNYVADHNYIYQIYDAGITHQFSSPDGEIVMRNVRFSCNLVEDTSYSFEYFSKHPSEGSDHHAEHVYYIHNILRRSGYGFGDQRPDKTAASHIKGWDHWNEAYDFIIADNIFDRGRYNLLHIGAEKAEWLPRMCNNIYVQKNGGLLGKFGTPPAKLYSYDESLEKTAEDVMRENDSAFYFED